MLVSPALWECGRSTVLKLAPCQCVHVRLEFGGHFCVCDIEPRHTVDEFLLDSLQHYRIRVLFYRVCKD